MSPLHWLPHHSHGALCQDLAAFPWCVLLGDGLCDQTFLTLEQPGERTQAFIAQVGLWRSGTPLLYGQKGPTCTNISSDPTQWQTRNISTNLYFFPPFFLSLCISSKCCNHFRPSPFLLLCRAQQNSTWVQGDVARLP